MFTDENIMSGHRYLACRLFFFYRDRSRATISQKFDIPHFSGEVLPSYTFPSFHSNLPLIHYNLCFTYRGSPLSVLRSYLPSSCL